MAPGVRLMVAITPNNRLMVTFIPFFALMATIRFHHA